jgi:hypothetical protein
MHLGFCPMTHAPGYYLFYVSIIIIVLVYNKTAPSGKRFACSALAWIFSLELYWHRHHNIHACWCVPSAVCGMPVIPAASGLDLRWNFEPFVTINLLQCNRATVPVGEAGTVNKYPRTTYEYGNHMHVCA